MRKYFGGRSRWRRMASVLILVSVSACGLRRGDPPVDRTQDERIRGEVEARLRAEPALSTSAIRVVVDGGSVRLHGSVRGMGAWRCALINAELVAGVRGVVDYLMIERGDRDANCLAPRRESGSVVRPP